MLAPARYAGLLAGFVLAKAAVDMAVGGVVIGVFYLSTWLLIQYTPIQRLHVDVRESVLGLAGLYGVGIVLTASIRTYRCMKSDVTTDGHTETKELDGAS